MNADERRLEEPNSEGRGEKAECRVGLKIMADERG